MKNERHKYSAAGLIDGFSGRATQLSAEMGQDGDASPYLLGFGNVAGNPTLLRRDHVADNACGRRTHAGLYVVCLCVFEREKSPGFPFSVVAFKNTRVLAAHVCEGLDLGDAVRKTVSERMWWSFKK